MRLLVTANHVPFMPGGADVLVSSLMRALQEAGHQAELLRLPFQFAPASALSNLMNYCESLDLSAPNGLPIDQLLSLQFPGYGIHHPNHRIWLMHQHRAAYELYQPQQASSEEAQLQQQIQAYDQRHLSSAQAVYTISQTVAARVQQSTGVAAQAVYHPPAGEQRYYTAESWGYIFCPSRLESLKRQELLIRAATHLKTPVKLLLAGEGGQKQAYQQLIDQLGVSDRVQLMGRISEAQKLACYAHALGVAFVPWNEDLGYITLEAMLAAKPVITCHDSGGPLEFVHHQQTGSICPPDPQELAASFDQLYRHPTQAQRLGQQGKDAYQALNLNWEATLKQLLGETP